MATPRTVPESEHALEHTPHEALDELLVEATLDERGFIAALIGARAVLDPLIARLREIVAPRRVDVFGYADMSRLNQQRDSLVGDGTITLLAIDDADQWARFNAPDLRDWIAHTWLVVPEPAEVPAAMLERAWRCYLEAVVERYAWLDLTGLLAGGEQHWRVPIDALYVELLDTGSELAAVMTADDESEPRHLLLTAEPGRGKTTWLRHRTLERARAALAAEGRPSELPVLFPAAAYAEACARRLRSVDEFLVEWLRDEFDVEHAAELIAYAGERLALHIDALDEVPTETLKLTVVPALTRFWTTSPASVAVTSRPAFPALFEKAFASFHLATLRSLEETEIERFVRAFLELHASQVGVTDSEARASSLLERILGGEELRRLAETPLTLAFLTLLDVTEGHVPEQRTLLYHRLAELLVERWNRARSLAGVRRTTPFGQALRQLAPLAWWWREEHQSSALDEATLLERLSTQLRQEGDTPDEAHRTARGFLAELRQSTTLLVVEGRTWRFFHPTLAEYLAGVELARSRSLRQRLVAENHALFEPRRRETVIFAAGVLGLVWPDDEALHELVEGVLRQSRKPGRYDARYSALVSGILCERVGLSRRDEERLIERAVELWFDYCYSSTAGWHIRFDVVLVAVKLWDRETLRRTFWSLSQSPSPVASRSSGYIDLGIVEVLDLFQLPVDAYLEALVSSPDPSTHGEGWAIVIEAERFGIAVDAERLKRHPPAKDESAYLLYSVWLKNHTTPD